MEPPRWHHVPEKGHGIYLTAPPTKNKTKKEKEERTGLCCNFLLITTTFFLLVLAVLSLMNTTGILAPVCWLGSKPAATKTVYSPAQAVQSRSPVTDVDGSDASPAATSSAPAPQRTVLKCFEVDQPVLLPGGPAESDGSSGPVTPGTDGSCTMLLMRRDFAWSYEDPFVANYTPPSCKFNRVVLNFTSVSHGRQYDRLAIMYFGDTEVWRTSTAQPTTPLKADVE